MSCIHYKFNSKLTYDMVTFNGLHITLSELKMGIMRQDKLKAAICDLQIINAQTKEEYTDDALIPRNSSVIVKRIPKSGVKATRKTFIINQSQQLGGSSKAIVIAANASEEDKIKAIQSCHEYGPINYTKNVFGLPPPNYMCFRCGNKGHFIRNCPTIGDKSFRQIRKSAGIPRSFMMEVDDPSIKGVMLTNNGTYAIPTINAEAYANGKKEKPSFLPQEQPSSPVEDPVPDELLCQICKELMTDAAVTPCCGNSYCDECVRTSLLESEDHVCPSCNKSQVSPDDLSANIFLRQTVNNFKNNSGCTISMCKAGSNSPTLSSAQQTSDPDDPLVVKPSSHNYAPSEWPQRQQVPPVYIPPVFAPLQHTSYLSQEEFYRQQQRLKEEGQTRSQSHRSRSHSYSRSHICSPSYKGRDGGMNGVYHRDRYPPYGQGHVVGKSTTQKRKVEYQLDNEPELKIQRRVHA